MAMMIGLEIMLGFFSHAKFVCSGHLLHFMVNFMLRVAKLCFSFSF